MPATGSAADAITTLKGVGPALAEKLHRLGITTVGQLPFHLPLRYQDRRARVPLGNMRHGREGVVIGQVMEARLLFGRRRSLAVTIGDDTGFITLRFYHFSSRQQEAFREGAYVRAFGEARMAGNRLELAHPDYRVFPNAPDDDAGEWTPIYPTTEGLGQARLRGLMVQVLAAPWMQAESYAALRWLHAPPRDADVADIEAHQEQVAFDELTAHFLIMKRRHALRDQQSTRALPQARQLGRELLNRLGFSLTAAQRRVTTEVLLDLAETRPMLRLLQGDVGSGKTVVAAFAAIRAAEHGAQTAVMAPTELLAEQHYQNFSEWLTPLGIDVVLITGSLGKRERANRITAIERGEALVAIGTHALFQNQVTFHDLALTVIDEQHRFGVHQRMALRDKGRTPHQLVMTATPIPRTLTMALYADMDVSIIDELPPGRQAIHTTVIGDDQREQVIERVAEACRDGAQAYWVCTLIEDSESLPANAAETTFAELREALPDIAVGLVHGRMSATEKSAAMAQFASGDLSLLVATTVIEVGVDVPNATLMVIENPERLGLAQLHQLRGRVGRGTQSSYCVLLYGKPLSESARARLDVIRASQDGFAIAEQDLAQRGPGELLGARQTGEQGFRVADLSRHMHLLGEVMARGDRMMADDDPEIDALLSVWAPPNATTLEV